MANGVFGGGKGTVIDPYLVEDINDLVAIQNNLKAYYKQTKNIDLQGYGEWFPLSGVLTRDWTPSGIVETDERFSGGYDGDKYSISNMIMGIRKEERDQFTGLFGSVVNATLKNITIVNPSFLLDKPSYTSSPQDLYINVLAFEVDDSTISNCKIKGIEYTIDQSYYPSNPHTAENIYIHGLIGWGYNVKLTDITITDFIANLDVYDTWGSIAGICFDLTYGEVENVSINNFIVNFSHHSMLGFECSGLVTDIYDSTISKSNVNNIIFNELNSGSIETVIDFEGIGAFHGNEFNTIKNSYVTGECNFITGDSNTTYTGIGSIHAPTVIEHCYVAISLKEPADNIYSNPFTIDSDKVATIKSSYCDIELSNVIWAEERDIYPERTTAQMKNKVTYIGWDFQDVWQIDVGKSYPYFRTVGTSTQCTAFPLFRRMTRNFN